MDTTTETIQDHIMTFTPITLGSGNVVHATSLNAPKKTACDKPAKRARVHITREIDCIDCLAALFYPVTTEAMKGWLDRNKFKVSAATVRGVAARKRTTRGRR
jgi:hypothetical protein